MRIALAQINPTVGDFEGNRKLIEEYIEKAHLQNAYIVVFPELSLCGYPPEDLLLREEFLKKTEETLERIIHFTQNSNSVVVLGYPKVGEDLNLYNALGVVYKGKLLGEYYKHYLPNYGVFDEYRYFKPGEHLLILEINNRGKKIKVGFLICEDVWHPSLAKEYALLGIQLLVVINASPYEVGKFEKKLKFVSARSTDGLFYTAYVNLVGGQDSLVFDGRSFVISPEGKLLNVGKLFEEDLVIADIDLDKVFKKRLRDQRVKEASICENINRKTIKVSLEKELYRSREKIFTYKPSQFEEEVFKALVRGIKDYFQKQGFKKAVLGLSGGIDSALTAVLAKEALGAENILGIYLPTKFNSTESYEDAKMLAENLRIQFKVIEIEPFFEVFEENLKNHFPNWKFNVADENIQARLRANILFYFSNKEGYIVLATSNKSESAVGYTTIYGDMAGGFAPLKDVYKTWVYRLAEWYNKTKGWDVIPERILKKPPSAELRPHQTDQDTLPPYEILDQILQLYIEEGYSAREIAEEGFNLSTVEKVIKLVKRAEYKRKQAPLGIKITKVSFDKDWRMPIVNRFTE
jgi:NAD+ synthase (glutamine-hydrolysing)